MHTVLDCNFAAVNEATAIKTTEHLIAGLKLCRVNRIRTDKYKLVLSFRWHCKNKPCGQINIPIVNSA